MRFWDSSAIVPLLCQENKTPAMRQLYEGDRRLVVWVFTRTEIVSALNRRLREGSLSRDDFSSAKRRLRILEEDWSETSDWVQVRERAERLLELHGLSSADALQLGAALVSVEEKTHGFGFVTLDTRLAECAAKEGFSVHGVPL